MVVLRNLFVIFLNNIFGIMIFNPIQYNFAAGPVNIYNPPCDSLPPCLKYKQKFYRYWIMIEINAFIQSILKVNKSS